MRHRLLFSRVTHVADFACRQSIPRPDARNLNGALFRVIEVSTLAPGTNSVGTETLAFFLTTFKNRALAYFELVYPQFQFRLPPAFYASSIPQDILCQQTQTWRPALTPQVMDTGENSCASGTSQASSQPPHLCQACLSVLKRDNLELKKVYPHHTSVKAFIEACYTRCLICSNLLSKLDIDDQENLMLLAEGKVPDRKIANKMIRHWVDVSEFREKYSDPAERDARFRKNYGEPTSWISFTMMNLTQWLGYFNIQIQLNPMYEAYHPSHLSAYRSSLKTLWKTVSMDWMMESKQALVFTQQGMWAVALMPRRKHLLIRCRAQRCRHC